MSNLLWEEKVLLKSKETINIRTFRITFNWKNITHTEKEYNVPVLDPQEVKEVCLKVSTSIKTKNLN